MKIHGEIEFTITEHSAEQVVAEMPLRAGILAMISTGKRQP